MSTKSNGHSNGAIVDEESSEIDAEMEKLLAQVKESRKSCKNTAQLLQELNGIFRE